jgi:hypothetical protein
VLPFAGGKNPEHDEGIKNQPGPSTGIVNLKGGFKAKQPIGAVDFKAADNQQQNKGTLHPVPETLKTSIEK